jgi:MoaA/NifB/PqqE/SkfB family radical SAM enzyme
LKIFFVLILARREVNQTSMLKNYKRIRLFDDESSEILHVHIELPYRICNFRCNYCYLPNWNKKIEPELLNNFSMILEGIKKIKRPLHIILPHDGEITIVHEFWPYLKKISALKDVRLITIFSNLTSNFEEIFNILPPKKISIIAAYHYHYFKNKEKQKEDFFRRLANLKEQAGYIVGNFVLSPDQIEYYDYFTERLKSLGVKPYPYPRMSKYTCKIDYEAHSKQDLIKVKNILKNDTNAPDIVNDFLFGKREKGLKCAAGRDHILIRADGEVTRCFYLQKESRNHVHASNEMKFDVNDIEHLGSMFNSEGPWIHCDYELCPTGGCGSNWPVSFSDKVTHRYKKVKSLFNFVARDPNDSGKILFELNDHPKLTV